MTPLATTARRLLALAALVPCAACSTLVDDETIGSPGTPAGGAEFRTYVALGTSLSAGFESGGINDSTQQESPAAVLAQAMGLTVGADWRYPAFVFPGCPAPYANILASQRVGNPTLPCYTRDPGSAAPFMHNLAIPGLRAAHILNVADLTVPLTDTLRLAFFITGGGNPIDIVEAVRPTFVTLEVGANDVLGAATRGDTTLLTPISAFDNTLMAIANRLAATGAGVAIANVPNVTVIPHFTRASVLFCLNTGACGIPAALPYSSPNFTISPACAPNAAGGVGDTYLLAFPATGAITQVLAAGGAATLDCANDVATVTTQQGTAPAGPTLNPVEYAVITARVASFNSTISQIATARNWALANLDSALAANAGQLPPLPNFAAADPQALFGPLISQDGVHPNRAGYRIMAQVFRNAINARYGTSVAAIN